MLFVLFHVGADKEISNQEQKKLNSRKLVVQNFRLVFISMNETEMNNLVN